MHWKEPIGSGKAKNEAIIAQNLSESSASQSLMITHGIVRTKEQLEALCFSERSAFLNAVKIEDQRILDIGCGDGRFTLQHFAYAASIYGIDTKQEEIDAALKALEESSHTHTEHIHFRCADVVDYPLADSSFDIAIFLRSF